MATNQWIDGSYVGADGAWAQPQWVQDSYGWYYQHADGSCTYNAFEDIGGGVFYFNEYGYMVTGLQLIAGDYYYFNGSGYMVTGWLWLDGSCYYFTSSGAMATNQWIDGSYVGADGAWIQSQWVQDEYGWYYRQGDGSSIYSAFAYIGGNTFYFNDAGYMVTGWQWISGDFYYFNGSGHMLTGWQWLDGSCYYFTSSGAMATNQWIDGSYVGADGAWQVIA